MPQRTMSSLSTHVLDISRGLPASNLKVTLEVQEEASWIEITKEKTNSDGRVSNLLSAGFEFRPGVYRLTFDTACYFKMNSVLSFYPFVTVIFEKTKDDHRHH